MHVEARQFVEQALQNYGPVTRHVVELGSRDANGGVRDLFSDAQSYVGIDINPGSNVDIVLDAATWQPSRGYQCVISTETFEHTASWQKILKNAAKALSPDGILIITCATDGRKPHSATIPNEPPRGGEYYKNVDVEDFRATIKQLGLQATITVDETHHDLYAVCRHRPPKNTGLKIIGAGMWRTGTVSLKVAIETLTGEPCYHMTELLHHPNQASEWLNVIQGAPPRWDHLLSGYGSTLDWPSLAFWQRLISAYPKALVLLSERDPEDWWRSINQTVLQSAPTAETARTPWEQLVVALFQKDFVGRHPTKHQAIEAYQKHNQLVRDSVPLDRLLEWQPRDGWLPLCRALDRAVPDEPFPHLNTSSEYRHNNKLG